MDDFLLSISILFSIIIFCVFLYYTTTFLDYLYSGAGFIFLVIGLLWSLIMLGIQIGKKP